MKFKSATNFVLVLTFLLLVTYLLEPLYTVYAQDTRPTGFLPPINISQSLPATPSGRPVFTLKDARAEFIKSSATRSALLKNKLLGFRNKEKATMVEKINSNLMMIDQKITDSMVMRLSVMTNILSKLQDRYNESTMSGKLNTSYQTSIDQAKTSIENAQLLVKTQAAKDYTIQVSSESAVQKDAEKSRNALHNDLKTTQEAVNSAKNSLVQAIQTIVQALGGNPK
jgi:hypothetical protein